MAILTSMPGCCTGRLLMDLGEHRYGHGGRNAVTQQQLFDLIDPQLFPPANSRYANWQVVIATTNAQQTVARRILEEIGFESNTEVSSLSEAKVFIMTDVRWQRIHAERKASVQAAQEAERRRRDEEMAARRLRQEQTEREHRERIQRDREERRQRALQQPQVVNETAPYRDANGRFARRPEATHGLQNGDRFRRTGDAPDVVRRYWNGSDVGMWGRFFRHNGMTPPPLTVRQSREAGWGFVHNTLPVIDDIPMHPNRPDQGPHYQP